MDENVVVNAITSTLLIHVKDIEGL